MGYYINPVHTDKEIWLIDNAVSYSYVAPTDFDSIKKEGNLPVVLVDNRLFTAAGVAFSKNEMEAFAYPDGREKLWFIVSIEKLLEQIPDLPV